MKNNIIQVLDLRDSPWVDGPGRTILQCAQTIAHEQCNIWIGAFTGDSHNDHAYLNKAKQLQLDVAEIKESRSFDRYVLDQITEIVNRESIDIIHSHDFRSNIYGLISAKKLGLPLVSTTHGWISNSFKGKVYTTLDKFLLRFHNKIITVSEIMRENLIKTGIQSDKINVINNALIIDDFALDKKNNKFRRQVNITPNKKIVANIGRLSHEKRQDLFLQAAKSICEISDDYVFLIIGVGPEKENLIRLTHELNINDKVIFMGYRDDMVDIYNDIDLVIQTSKTEGMPNVILESLLMQVPVIATDVGGTSQIVKHKKNGYLIEPENIDNLTSAILEFNRNSSLFYEMGLAGREYIIENFNHTKRVDQLLSVYIGLNEA